MSFFDLKTMTLTDVSMSTNLSNAISLFLFQCIEVSIHCSAHLLHSRHGLVLGLFAHVLYLSADGVGDNNEDDNKTQTAGDDKGNDDILITARIILGVAVDSFCGCAGNDY